MIDSLITMSVAGLIAGFFFSMPSAGPVSILIISNALKCKLGYCIRANIGAAFADFIYVFIGTFGLTKLYSLYKPAIPYFLLAGMLFLLVTGYKITRIKMDPEHLPEINTVKKIKHRGAFYTGFMVNFLNPALFVGWLTISFLAISFVASLGFNTGGLNAVVNQNVTSIDNITGLKIQEQKILSNKYFDKIYNHNKREQNFRKDDPSAYPGYFHFIISSVYAFFLSLGSVIWFHFLSLIFTKFRKYVNLKIVNRIIFGMGIVLCIFGLYFGYIAIKTFSRI